MSIAVCTRCSAYVDTDFFPMAWIEIPNYTNTGNPVNPVVKETVEYICLCERCQEDCCDEDGNYCVEE